MCMRKATRKIGGAIFYHSPTNSYGTSGHVKWHPELLNDPNLYNDDVSARIQVVGPLEGNQFLEGTKHFDEEDGLLFVTKEVYVRKSPVGQILLVERASIMKGDLVAKRYDETPVYGEDLV